MRFPIILMEPPEQTAALTCSKAWLGTCSKPVVHSELKKRQTIVAGLLAVVFIGAGVSKIAALALPAAMFRQFGLPLWMMVGIGAAEIVLALMLIARSTRSHGAVGLSLIMMGASLSHVMTGVMLPMLFANAVLCFAAGWLVMGNRPAVLQATAAV